jgi:type I restriction enzyme S subunit
VGRKGSIGNVYYLDVDFWAHDTSLYVTNFFGNNQKYIYYLFLYLELERFGTKSGSPSLNRNDIHPQKISLPKPMEQERISKMLSHFDTSISNLKSGLNKLQHQKNGLMQDLLTGKVRVTNLLKEREPTSP